MGAPVFHFAGIYVSIGKCIDALHRFTAAVLTGKDGPVRIAGSAFTVRLAVFYAAFIFGLIRVNVIALFGRMAMDVITDKPGAIRENRCSPAMGPAP